MRGIFGTPVMAGLTTLFNVLALNLVLVVASLPLVTAFVLLVRLAVVVNGLVLPGLPPMAGPMPCSAHC